MAPRATVRWVTRAVAALGLCALCALVAREARRYPHTGRWTANVACSDGFQFGPLEYPDMMTLFDWTREIGEGGEGRVRKVRQRPIPEEHQARMLPLICADEDIPARELGAPHYCKEAVPGLELSPATYADWFQRRTAAVLQNCRVRGAALVVKDSYQEKVPQIKDVYFGLLTASLPALAPYVPSFAGYACTYSTLGEIDGFRGLCGRAGGLSVYWRDDSLEVFYPRGGLDTDKELSGDRDTETHLRDLAATAAGRDQLRSAFGVASDEEVLAKVQEGAAAALSALHAAGIAHGDVRLANFICTQSAPARVQLVDFGYAVDLAFATREALPGIEELEAAVDFTRKAKDADKPVRAILQKIVAAPTADAAELLAKDREDLARALDSFAATLRRAPETSSGGHFHPGPGGSGSDSDYDSDEDSDSEDLVVAAHAISAILASEIDRYDTREE